MLITLFYIIAFVLLAWIYGITWVLLSKSKFSTNIFYPLIPGISVLGIISVYMVCGGPVGYFSTLVVYTGAAIMIWRYKNVYRLHFQNLKAWFLSLNKIIYLFISLLIIISFQSAQITKINDMGMYYLQTLRWFREYGIVKGLGNLHPALGLGSAWHSLLVLTGDKWVVNQTEIRIFGINGALIICFLLWFYIEWKLTKSKVLLGFSIPFFLISFFYLTGPSPDMPVLAGTFWVFWYSFIRKEELRIYDIILTSIFVFSCKPSALLVVFISIFLVLQILFSAFEFKTKVKKIFYLMLLVISGLGPLLYKNYIQTGYPVYPAPLLLSQLGLSNPDWLIPEDWNFAYRNGIQTFGVTDKSDSKTILNVERSDSRWVNWVSRTGYKGWMNRIIALNFIMGILFFILALFKRKFSGLLIFLLLLQIVEWYYLSQYRLMLPLSLCLLALNFEQLLLYFNSSLAKLSIAYNQAYRAFTVDGFLILLLFIYCLFTFYPGKILSEGSRNQAITSIGTWSAKVLISPSSDYRFEPIDSVKAGNAYVYFYPGKSYSWDCPLPAMSKGQQYFTKEVFGYQLEYRGTGCSEGFRLVRLNTAH